MSDHDLPTASLRGDYQPAASAAPAGDETATPLPTYTLFSPKQIGVATFFGGPISAGVLFWWNFKRLGASGKATAALVLGIAATVGMCALSLKLPESFPRMAIPVAYTLAIAQYAKASQTVPYEYHLALQGKAASSWAAFGIAIASLALSFGMIVGIVFVQTPDKIDFGPSQVYYTSGGTHDEAQRLGDELVHIGYFNDNGATVTVKRAAGRHVIAFVVRDSALGDPAIAEGFRGIAPELSDKVFGGEPVDLWLNDDHDRTKVRLMWESPAVAP